MIKDIKIRFAYEKDLPIIIEIYNQAIRSKSATADLVELKLNDKIDWFAQFDPEHYPIYVVEEQNAVIGYGYLSPYRQGREALSSAAEISYYLDNEVHGRGIGTRLLQFMIQDCQRIGIKNLLAILLEINIKSIGLLKKMGFKQWGYLPNIAEINNHRFAHLIYGLSVDNVTFAS